MSEVRSPETIGFQAEVKQLLHLMVHSLRQRLGSRFV
jgi:HSP90 family molecular chaperone